MNIDSLIFLGFLALNLGVGLFVGRGVTTLKQYAVGDRNFSTGTIAATIIATWIGASFFAFNLSKAYSDGLPFITAVIGNGFMLFLLGQFYGPRMIEFLGKNSVAEAIGSIYGNRVRLITAIAAICLATGYTGLQIKVLSTMMNWTFGISTSTATILSASVVILYSSFGGIRSVTFTDIIQFLTFGAFIPGIAIMLWGLLDNQDQVMNAIRTHNVLDTSKLYTVGWVFMVIWFAIPALDPSIFQRVLMSKNILQMRNAFRIASVACMIIIILTSWVGILVLATNDALDPDQIILYLIENYSYTGLKGLTIAGISAMVMSTVDSYINSASILFTNDVCKTLNIKVKDELALTRIVALIIGSFALIISLSFDNFYNLTLAATNMYIPVVTAPLTLAIFGFRSTEKVALIGMSSGILTVILWKIFSTNTEIDSVIPGLIVNFLMIFLSHYLLRQQGGWVGIKDNSLLVQIRENRRKTWQNMKLRLNNFILMKYLCDHTPNKSSVHIYFGAYLIISSFTSVHLMEQDIFIRHMEIMEIMQNSSLIFSTLLLTYPIWPASLKSESLKAILWCVVLLVIAIIFPLIALFVNGFNQTQSLLFFSNIIVIAMLLRWDFSLVIISLGTLIGLFSSNYFLSIDIDFSLELMDFQILYIFLFICMILIAFIRPRQIEYDSITAVNKYLTSEIENREAEMLKALELKYEFVRNINHEIRIPLTSMNIIKELDQKWDSFSDDERKAYTRTVAESATRLGSFVQNILDFSKLSSNTIDLKLEEIDLSYLVEEIFYDCKSLYSNELVETEVIAKIEPTIKIKADKYYIYQLINNLIINAIKYSQSSPINIHLRKITKEQQQFAEFTIEDNGVGIPKNELNDIFSPFTVSSKTRSAAGGRGMGLALCSKVIEVHHGTISAESSGDRGSKFTFLLPLNAKNRHSS